MSMIKSQISHGFIGDNDNLSFSGDRIWASARRKPLWLEPLPLDKLVSHGI
jgi:hypothetical protein